MQKGQLADLVVLSKDYFSVAEEEIKGIESVLTIVDGKVVYAAGHFSPLAPPPIPVLPEWSPVVKVPGPLSLGAACGCEDWRGGADAPVLRQLRRARTSA